MPLGSLARWQSLLFCLMRLSDTYFQTDIPIIVVITTLISFLFFFQFEYIDGSVISALAILETPNPLNAEKSQKVALSEVGETEGPPAGQSGIITTDESENTWQFHWDLRQNLVRNVIPFLYNSFLSHASLYILSLTGFIGMNSNNIPGLVFWFAIGIIGKMFAIPTSFNAVTSQRSLARRLLHTEGEIWPIFIGLDIFMVYMLMTVVIMVPAKSNYTGEVTFPVLIISRLFLGLTLTNLHTAWVHTVISKPTKKSIWQKIPGWRKWLEILPVASLDIVLPNCVYYLAKALLVSFRGVVFASLGDQDYENIPSALTTCGSVAFVTIPIVSKYLVSLFTRVLYVRVAASMLPDNDQSIVPFDRSFGGRANNETHRLSILDAFRTMKVQNWYRYLKIVWEVLMYEISWLCPFIIVIAMELYYWAPDTAIDLLVLLVPKDF